MDTNNAGNEYFDLDDALSRIGGNMGLYKRLLGRFIEGNHYEALETALQSGDKEEAARQAHSLKGVSANLSLVKIRALSVELEQLIKDDADHTECLAALKQAFDATVEKAAEIMN
ncbi:MAG: Hpt domain-containing protein [Oscillospiraceae bacterium]|nr:Hpt domain-containing protein [Oscillospiraceae bacterium]